MREFRQKFSTQGACVEYLFRCRWPDGFICPRCGGKQGTLLSSRALYQCRECRYQSSATAGTIMHRSRIPLQEWFSAAYLVATLTPGISALQLQRQLGISSNDTALHLLHRLRNGMVNDNRSRLSGLIEADETFIGGPAKGKRGRGVGTSPHVSLIVGGVEVVVYQDAEGKRK